MGMTQTTRIGMGAGVCIVLTLLLVTLLNSSSSAEKKKLFPTFQPTFLPATFSGLVLKDDSAIPVNPYSRTVWTAVFNNNTYTYNFTSTPFPIPTSSYYILTTTWTVPTGKQSQNAFYYLDPQTGKWTVCAISINDTNLVVSVTNIATLTDNGDGTVSMAFVDQPSVIILKRS